MKGRDLLIGAVAGGILVILLTHTGGKTPHAGHSPSASASPAASAGKHHHHGSKHHTHHTAAPKTHQATAKPQHTAGAGASASATPQASGHPSAHPTPSGHAASPTAKSSGSSGLGNGLIAVACLIAIAAALFTVTMTVRGLRAANDRKSS
jgi:hypothetical protein